MCDAGRLSYVRFSTPDRLRGAFIRGDEGTLEASPLDAAVDAAAARLRALIEASGSGVVGCVASARSTNEDLFVLRRFADGLEIENAGVSVPQGESDDLLRHAEAVPNAAGARALGFGDARDIVERLRGGGLHGLVVFGSDFADTELAGELELLSDLDTVILIDTHQSALQRLAHVVLPVRHLVEREGTLTNCDGRVQRVRRVLEPRPGLLEEGALIARLGAALGIDGFDGCFDAAEISRALAEARPRFAGAAMDAIPAEGRLLGPAEEEV
jgi:predicted molibdopterin-dependent oxidoreductase YjgC